MDQRSVTRGLIVRLAVGVFGLLTLATLMLAVFSDKGLLQVRAQERRLNAIEQEVQSLQTENERVADEIKALRTDPKMIERVAREELKLVKPGEVVIVTPAETPSKRPDSAR